MEQLLLSGAEILFNLFYLFIFFYQSTVYLALVCDGAEDWTWDPKVSGMKVFSMTTVLFCSDPGAAVVSRHVLGAEKSFRL